YQKSLDKLERLIIQRLFELEKSRMRGTGYKLRVQIAKGLQERSKTIRAALSKFNKAARDRDGSHQNLELTHLIEAVFIADVSILRECRIDVRNKLWTKPLVRKAIVAWQETLRAKEELQRVAVETRRLHTWIFDEEELLELKIQELRLRKDVLGEELAHRRALLVQVHDNLLRTIYEIESIPGYVGT
ncbi:hypothetical protein BOTBODRAFT_77299, partial [Botryobasidium botryosum FD-172 SS1]